MKHNLYLLGTHQDELKKNQYNHTLASRFWTISFSSNQSSSIYVHNILLKLHSRPVPHSCRLPWTSDLPRLFPRRDASTSTLTISGWLLSWLKSSRPEAGWTANKAARVVKTLEHFIFKIDTCTYYRDVCFSVERYVLRNCYDPKLWDENVTVIGLIVLLVRLYTWDLFCDWDCTATSSMRTFGRTFRVHKNL